MDRSASSRPLAVRATGLVKQYGRHRALDGVDLEIARYGVHALLGPNGAGKTTAIRVLTTLTRPTLGSVTVLGDDVVAAPAAIRARIALTGQFASLDEDLTGRENLTVLGRLHGLSWRAARRRSIELLDEFDLADAGTRSVKTYSGGMRRRLDLAASLVVRPELLFLDEPTTGLDPRSRSRVWETVEGLVGDGTTVILTTQYLDEADRLADRITVVDHGRVIAEGTAGELKASVGSGAVRVRISDPAIRDQVGRRLSETLGTVPVPGGDPAEITLRTDRPHRVARAIAQLTDDGIEITEYSVGQPSLDEVFLALTGQPASAGASRAEVPA